MNFALGCIAYGYLGICLGLHFCLSSYAESIIGILPLGLGLTALALGIVALL